MHPGILEVTVEDREFAVIEDGVEDLSHRLQAFTETELLDELDKRAGDVRERLQEIWALLRSTASRRGPKVLVLRLPERSVEGVEPTPVQHITPDQPNLFSPDLYRGLLIAMADWYGYGFTTQQHGVIHNNVIAVKNLARTPGYSASAKYGLDLHTEEASFAFHEDLDQNLDISPDFFSLHFLRNPAKVPTVVSVPDPEELSAKSRELLRERWFVNHTSPAHGGDKNDPRVPMSIIYGPRDQPWIRLNLARSDTGGYRDEYRNALMDLRWHLERRKVELALSAGEIAVIDNRRVVHGRPAYTRIRHPRYDGSDRWHRRLAASNDRSRIQKFESACRVADTRRFLAAVKEKTGRLDHDPFSRTGDQE